MGRWFGKPADESGDKRQFETTNIVLTDLIDEWPSGYSSDALYEARRIVRDRLRRLG